MKASQPYVEPLCVGFISLMFTAVLKVLENAPPPRIFVPVGQLTETWVCDPAGLEVLADT